MPHQVTRASALIATFGLVFMATSPEPAAAQDSDPRRWLQYKTLKGSIRAGSGKGAVSLGPLWTEGKSNFKLDATFELRQTRHEPYWGRVEFVGKLKGTVSYGQAMKGVTTEDLKSRTEQSCGGAIGPESEVRLSLSYKDGTFTFDAMAPARCSANRLSVNTTQQGNTEIDMGDEMSFSVLLGPESLSKGLPLPRTGSSFSRQAPAMIVPGGGIALPFDGHVEFTIGPAPPPPRVQVRVVGDGCSCNREVATFRAEATKKGGTFETFRVEGGEVVSNKGGAQPILELVADARKARKARVTAVYVLEGERFESPPLDVEFLRVEKPELGKGEHHFWENDYVYKRKSLAFDASTRGWTNGEEAKGVEWLVRPGRPVFNLEDKSEPGSSGGKLVVEVWRDELPEGNADFGARSLHARASAGECSCDSDPAEFRTFFYPFDKDNPGGELPNWAYYWRQTRAAVPGLDFTAIAVLPPPFTKGGGLMGALCREDFFPADDPAAAQARYELLDGNLYMKEDFMRRDCAPRAPGERGSQWIDCFAELLRHEGHHKMQLTSWWGPKLANYRCGQDTDGDLVPDDVEDATPGCNPKIPASCPGRPSWLGTVLPDIEYEAYRVGWSWTRGSADSEDWSVLGRNDRSPRPGPGGR